MVEIKDLIGLREPLKKLIEVIAEGVGGVSRPFLTRKNANAKAYEIQTIAQAISDSQKLVGPIKYENDSVKIETSANTEQTALPEANLNHRIMARKSFQEAKKQSNIELITQHAAEELRDEKNIDSEKPDTDWTSRFFRIAEDITSDQMQMLWGKVLAGEVKKPGSYSLRALDLLKNINQKEAKIFVKVGQISFSTKNTTFIPNPDHGKYLRDHLEISFSDLMVLREIGLLVANDLQYTMDPVEEETPMNFACGKTIVRVNQSNGTPDQSISVIAFTEIGRELLQLVEKKIAAPKYIKKFASLFQHKGVTIQSGLIVEQNGSDIKCTNLQNVPTEIDSSKDAPPNK